MINRKMRREMVRRSTSKIGTDPAEQQEQQRRGSIFASIGAVAYRTDDDGRFYDPDPELIRLFLGPGKTIADLERMPAHQLYMIPDQRKAFLARLRHTPGEIVNDYVLLKLEGSHPTWCRVRSRCEMTATGPLYEGIVVRLVEGDSWLPGKLLARKGYSYLRVDLEGRILYGFSSSMDDGEDIVPPGAMIKEIGKKWRDTHWASPGDCDALLSDVLARRQSADSWQLERVVKFKDPHGIHRRVIVQAGLRHSEVEQAAVFEIIWRDASRLDARLSAVRLRENVDSLRAFENALVSEARVIAGGKHAAFYRLHPEEVYILRSVAGLPPTVVLRRSHTCKPDLEKPMEESLVVRPSGEEPFDLDEHLVPLIAGGNPFGCLWIATERGRPLPQTIHTFAESLGTVASGAEAEAAKRTASRALQAAVDILRKNETATVYEVCARALQRELSAAGVSIFEAEPTEGSMRLVLKYTTGIEGIASEEDWPKVTYKVGHQMTGSSATRLDGAISVLDVQKWRAGTPWQEPLYPENVPGGPVSWLGCPIRNVESPQKELIGFVRLVNREVTRDQEIDVHLPPAGFSQGDVLLANALASVAAQYHPMQMMLREHLRLISRTAHELQAPIVSIRAKAHTLLRYWDEYRNNPEDREKKDAAARAKLTDVEYDATNLSDTVYVLSLAARGEAPTPRLRKAGLLQDMIRPTALGALKRVAVGLHYEGVHVSWTDVNPGLSLTVDPSMMRSVFYNLFINAIKYGPDPRTVHVPSIVVKASLRGAECQILVMDWGMGIPMELREKIFELYFRSPAAVRRDPTGSGIGLFVVRSILEKHGGSIELTSGDHPTEFLIRLPR